MIIFDFKINLYIFRQFLGIFEGIFEDIWGYFSKKYWKIKFAKKMNTDFWKLEKMS